MSDNPSAPLVVSDTPDLKGRAYGCADMSTTGPDSGQRIAAMAIIGAHVLLYTPEAEKVRAIFRDVFGWKHVDAGDGWLIFQLPPAELGIHPAEGHAQGSGGRHQFELMCDDIHATIRDLRDKGIEVAGEPRDEGYGIIVTLKLPGGLEVELYEPRHPVAIAMEP